MVAAHRTIKITPDSSLESVLANADDEPIVLDRNGVRYHLRREDKTDIWEGYEPDPEETLKMLDEVAGSWSDLDVDKLIADLYEAREKGSRPIDRP